MKGIVYLFYEIGLEYPLARIMITSKTAREMEDEVCARMVREMRKPPAPKNDE